MSDLLDRMSKPISYEVIVDSVKCRNYEGLLMPDRLQVVDLTGHISDKNTRKAQCKRKREKSACQET